MNRWLICGDQMEYWQFQRQNSAFARNSWHDQHSLLAKSTSTKNFNSKRKDSQKISLKNANKHHKQQHFLPPPLILSRKQSYQVIKTQAFQQQKIVQYRSQKYNNSPKLQYKKIIPATKFNAQAVHNVYIRNQIATAPVRVQKPSNVKIFYCNQLQNQIKKQNPQVKTDATITPQPTGKSIKRLNTMPQMTEQVSQSLIFFNQAENKMEQKMVGVTKSMDYTDTIKSINLKGTQNLHQIECIKAQSIPDEEIQDQFSIVVSPLDEDLDIKREDVIRDIWIGFNGKELKSKQSLYAHSADTAEE